MRRNVGNLIYGSLSSGQLELIRRAADEATALRFPLYIVGGVVRDLALGRTGRDMDLIVEGDAVALARRLVVRYGGKATTHIKFGTAKLHIQDWQLGDGQAERGHAQLYVDLISCRGETYKHPAALPTVRPGTIEDDLRRRDFTINALALRVDKRHFGDLIDEVGGWDDLQKGLIRVLHPNSFLDDPTRMYRAARYEQRYGFKIVGETMELIPEARALVARLTAHRIRHELDLIFREPMASAILARLAQINLLAPIHPALGWDVSIKTRFRFEKDPELVQVRIHSETMGWLLWTMSLSQGQIESLHSRLHFSAQLMKLLVASSRLFSDVSRLVGRTPSQCVEYLDKLPLAAIYAVHVGLPRNPKAAVLGKYLTEWRHVQARTTGHDLKKRGVQPGPVFHDILSQLRNAWLDGQVHNETEERQFLEATLVRLNVMNGSTDIAQSRSKD